MVLLAVSSCVDLIQSDGDLDNQLLNQTESFWIFS